jgi:hypothetical protein
MKNCNWMVTDVINKKNDIVRFIKSSTVRLSEDRIVKIGALRLMNADEMNCAWLRIPVEFKSKFDLNIGTA